MSMITERPDQGRSPGLLPAPRAAEPARRRDVGAVIKAYVSLTKPRIVELLLVTTVPAMMLAAGGWPDPWLVAVVLVGGSLAAGAASALNCYIDRDIDQLMRRTKRRPLLGARRDPALGAGVRPGAGGHLGRAHGCLHQLAGHGDDGGLHLLLRRGLHALAEAPDSRRTRSGAASAVRRPCSSAGRP
nr:hypothetical protein GCM10020092_084410 [Actinoplanes digitatis]